METLKQRTISTDVLIIGAGGAGIRAAIEAHNMGAKVLVVSKGSFPSGCVTATAMGAMLAPFDRQDSVKRHIEDTLRGGHYLNDPDLVRILVSQATQRALDLDRYGTEFDGDDGRYTLFPFTGSTVPRGVLAGDRYRGGFFKGLVKEAQRLEIDILDEVMVAEILKEGNVVAGAVALDLRGETVLVIRAKALVMAVGGAGNLYSLTTNIPGITGDGYALAYRAGAKLSDMEFMQSRACMIYPAGMRGTPPPADGCVTIGGRFFSGIGGQVDFIRGAARSRGGRPIIALPSTARDGKVSRICAALEEGAGVVTSRGDIRYVVTEYGVADLWGKNIRQRSMALIDIAHPDFRSELLAAAKARKFIFPG